MFGVTSRAIRYYEELGLIDPENRDEGAHRRYSDRNVVRLKRIQQLKDYGLTLAEIAELFDLARRDRSGDSARKSLAEKYRSEWKRRGASKRLWNSTRGPVLARRTAGAGIGFLRLPGRVLRNLSMGRRCDVRSLLSRKRN